MPVIEPCGAAEEGRAIVLVAADGSTHTPPPELTSH